LAEKILTSKVALEGERKQVTILFADLKGSMELLADRDPEEARKLLDPVLEQMMEAVHRYEGTVNQVMGDGIMALFGAPLSHEDHAVRACYAALRMQDSVGRYADGVRRSHGIEVRIRVGLNSGQVVVRSIGSDLHMDYTAVGQTTHLAARMEQLANPGSIRLTAATLRLAEGYIDVKALGLVPVKGLREPIDVYEVTGAGTVRSRLQAAAVRGFTRFVGRDAELDHLRRVQELAGSGHGQVAAVVGEAGVGKSRLLYEFIHSHRLQGWLILEAASVSYGKATSYLPVIDLLKGYFKIQDRDDLREIREKVTGKLLTLEDSLKPVLPALLALLDVPIEDAAWAALDPAERRRRTLDAARRLLLRESREQPLLLIFEDLHWIDSETQALLDGLVESLGSTRLMLLVNYRPEYQHSWVNKTYYSQMRLDALPAESAGELLDALLGDDRSLAPLKQLLVKRGNPFFLEETIRTLVETQALAGEGGRYRLTQPIQIIQVPATVQTMLTARIDRLDPEDKRLLQVASVVGKDVPFALLQAIAGLPDEALRRGLGRLQAAEFLYETELYPDLEHTFKHALTHEVTYGGLLQERRRELHARIVDAVEHLYPERLTEHVERLARHAFLGEVWDKALPYLRAAGAKAAARSVYREAMSCFEQALATVGRLPQRRDTIEQAIDIRFELRNAFGSLGELARMHDLLREADALATSLGDSRRIGQVSAHLAFYFVWTGQPDRGVEAGQRALTMATELGDLGLDVLASVRLGQAYFNLGEYRRALEIFSRNAETVQSARIHEHFSLPFIASVYIQASMADCLRALGDFTAAKMSAEKAVDIAEVAGHELSLVTAYWTLGMVHLSRGDFDQAARWLEPGLDRCREGKFPFFFAILAGAVGRAYVHAARIREALVLLHQAVDQSSSIQMMAIRIPSVAYLGEAHLRAGELADALRCGQEALDLSRAHRQLGFEAEALRIIGEIRSLQNSDHIGTAETLYYEAIELAEPRGMRPVVAHCHLGLGKLYRRTGKRQAAQQHLTMATTMYREMDMKFWLEQADAESNQLA
jgi:class 3 adenylate cyclase/tetratricopeptide (TPR) repeat protein